MLTSIPFKVARDESPLAYHHSAINMTINTMPQYNFFRSIANVKTYNFSNTISLLYIPQSLNSYRNLNKIIDKFYNIILTLVDK